MKLPEIPLQVSGNRLRNTETGISAIFKSPAEIT